MIFFTLKYQNCFYYFLYNMRNNNYYLTIREQDYFQSQNNIHLCIHYSYRCFEIEAI